MNHYFQDEITVGSYKANNRMVFLPMEGADCNLDGSPSEITINRYKTNVKSGAGIVWFEATAVCEEGKSNPRQMMITRENIDSFKNMVKELKEYGIKENGFEPLFAIQLTHSGRQSMRPLVVYHNDIYEKTKPVSDDQILSDEYLDTVPEMYKNSAVLAEESGFDLIDVKTCHGYLMQESLSAFFRKGRYGGSFENRSSLYLNCVREVKNVIKKSDLVARVGVCDMVPYPYGFGNDGFNNIDYKEPFMLIEKLVEIGIKLLCITIGNPYYNPHINRPFKKGPYESPEDVITGFNRIVEVERKLKERFKDLKIVGIGFSCLKGEMMEKAESLLKEGVCEFVGFGRQTFAYPMFYKDYLEGNFKENKCCLTCSRCTELMRNRAEAGCAIFNEYYRNLYKERITCKK